MLTLIRSNVVLSAIAATLVLSGLLLAVFALTMGRTSTRDTSPRSDGCYTLPATPGYVTGVVCPVHRG